MQTHLANVQAELDVRNRVGIAARHFEHVRQRVTALDPRAGEPARTPARRAPVRRYPWSVALGDRHQKKDVEAALKRAERAGLKVTHDKNRHRWGWVLCCPCNQSQVVYCTPRNPGDEARKIDLFVNNHRGHA